MLKKLKKDVFEANKLLPKYGLVTLTWGNVSGIDREKNLIVIKPSGVSYEEMTEDDMVVVDMEGNVVEGNLKPSSDTKTHIHLYKNFANIGAVVHTHSPWATSWAQAGREIPCYGTTHADYVYGAVPMARELTDDEINSDYEKNTGVVIVERFLELDYSAVPVVLCKNHGPFAWGENPKKAVENALVLEQLAKMAYRTEHINKNAQSVKKTILDKHYFRKHGKDAYYGQ